MGNLEDEYLDLYATLLDSSEFAAGVPGTRFDFDSASWAVSALSSVLTVIGAGILSATGEQIAQAAKERLKRLGDQVRKPSHESNIEELAKIRRITVEITSAEPTFVLPPDLRRAIVEQLIESGLDRHRAEKVAGRVVRAILDD